MKIFEPEMFVAIFLEILIALIDLFLVMTVIFVIFSNNLKNAEYSFKIRNFSKIKISVKNQKLFDSI